MSQQDLFVDTTVLAYAIGGPHEHRESCTALVQLAATSEVTLHASVEAIAELVFHRMRRESRIKAVQAARIATSMLVLHDFDAHVMLESLDLLQRTSLRSRDAVHAATAISAGFSRIVTTDRDFDSVAGLRAVLPSDALRLD